MQRPKTNHYINNKTLLREIALSKLTYCSYMDLEDTLYDRILQDGWPFCTSCGKQSPPTNAVGKPRRQCADEECKGTVDHRPWQLLLPKSINKVRIMTYSHVPPGKSRSRSPAAKGKQSTNFPPFRHFQRKGDEWQEILRSHWDGGFENGHFSLTHGHLTPELAKAILLISNKYRNRGNWRMYSYADEFEAEAIVQLTVMGLKFDESKGSNPFAFWTTILKNSFRRVLGKEKVQSRIKDDLLIMDGRSASYGRQVEDELRDTEYRLVGPGPASRADRQSDHSLGQDDPI